MIENKQKHLEFIQNIINRMGQNSFYIKGWTVTLVSALFALGAKDTKHTFILLAYFPSLAFWLLDSYFLYQERLYRKVYDETRNKEHTDFSLNTKTFDKGLSSWTNAFFSKTILIFYVSIIVTIFIVMITLNKP